MSASKSRQSQSPSRRSHKSGASPRPQRRAASAARAGDKGAERINRARNNAARFSARLQGAAKEGVAIVMLALCAFLLLAFFSYTPADPGWSHSGPEDRVANWMGPAGAWLSDVLYSLFGASALWGPAILGLGAWRLMRAREAHLVWDPVALAVRGGGMLLVLMATCTLGALHFHSPTSDLPYGAGGIVGVGVSAALSSLVGIHGTTLLSLAAFLCGTPLLTGLSWLAIVDELGAVAIRGARWLKGALTAAGTRLGDKRREMALERRRSYEAAQQEDDIDFGHDDEVEDAHAEAAVPDERAADMASPPRSGGLLSRLGARRKGGHDDALATSGEDEPAAVPPAGQRTEPSLSTREDDDDTIPWERAGDNGAMRTVASPDADADAGRPAAEEERVDAARAATWGAASGAGMTAAPADRAESRTDETGPAAAGEGAGRADVTRRRIPEVIPEPQTADDDDVAPGWTAPIRPAESAASRREASVSPEPLEASDRQRPAAPVTPNENARPESVPALEWEEDEPLSSGPLSTRRHDDEPVPESRFDLVFDEDERDDPVRQGTPPPAFDGAEGEGAASGDAAPTPAAPSFPAPEAETAEEDQENTPTLWTVQQMQTQQRPAVDEGQAPEGRVPPLSLLTRPSAHEPTYTAGELEEMAELLEVRLREYGVKAEVVDTWPGPVITRFEIKPAPGVKVSKISNLAKDLARSLMVKSVRVVEIIPGRPTVGIEIPNPNRAMIRLREVFDSDVYQDARSPVTLALGQDIGGNPVVANLNKMPHLLVAGTTGSGKSVGVNAMLISMLLKATPDEVRMIMVDPKMLELSVYDGIPHLLAPVVTDMKEAANALRWCVAEMERRYKLMAAMGVRNLAGFNARIDEATEAGAQIADPLWEPQPWEMHVQPPVLEKLPYIVVVIDEFADMFMIVGKKVEELIARIAQKARAAGIHLILATQRPSVDVVTGLIKANIPTRMAFQVSSRIDSRTILDQGGAEHLLGHGDMLYLPAGAGMPTRVHGAFVDDDEVHRVVDDWKRRGEPEYIDEILSGGVSADGLAGLEAEGEGSDDPEQDALYDEAVAYVTESRRASISAVQRRFKIGYNRAARLVEAMEGAGVVSSMGSNGSREVLASPPAN